MSELTYEEDTEYLFRGSILTEDINDINIVTIENPLSILDDTTRKNVVANANEILIKTTGIADRRIEDVEKFLFGIKDKGRVLLLFEDREEKTLLGFLSMHLLNENGSILRFNGKSVLHVGSGHIELNSQGNKYWLQGLRHYVEKLPLQIRPSYIEGFTQNPRLLKLLYILTNNNVFPTPVEGSKTEELRSLQKQLLPIVTRGSSFQIVKNSPVLKGTGETVYCSRPKKAGKFDDFFYNKLGVIPENGDFLHFIANIPENFYNTE